jgi:ABC-type glycerol-3-phosphate transport system permease component
MFGEDKLWSRYLKRAAVCIAILISFFPIFWLVSTSFKPIDEWQKFPPVWISSQPTLQNYRIVFAPKAAQEFAAKQNGAISYKVSGSAWKAFGDSAIIAIGATALSVIFGALAAYSIVRSSSLQFECSRPSLSSCPWSFCFRCCAYRTPISASC